MDKGITNLEINKFFENEENQDIKNNWMRVCSIDSITRYINFYEIIKKEMHNMNLQFLIRINTTNPTYTGRVLWIFTKKNVFYYLIALD